MMTRTHLDSLKRIKSISVIVEGSMLEFQSDVVNKKQMFFNPVKHDWVEEKEMIEIIAGYEMMDCIVIPELKDEYVSNKHEETLNCFADYDMSLSELIDNSSMIVVTEGKNRIGTFILDNKMTTTGRYGWVYESNVFNKYQCSCKQVEMMLEEWGKSGYQIAFYDHGMNLI